MCGVQGSDGCLLLVENLSRLVKHFDLAVLVVYHMHMKTVSWYTMLAHINGNEELVSFAEVNVI